MLTWRFYINDTEVEEPVGWDAVEFNLQRSDQYIGLENVYSDNFLFDQTGGVILKDIYTADGIDGVAAITIKSYCDTVLQETIYGVLNFISYKEINGEVSIKLEPSSFKRTVINRFDSKVDLRGDSDLDGNYTGAFPIKTIIGHSKAIVESSELGATDAITITESISNGDMLGNISIPMVYDLLTDELQNTLAFVSFYYVGAIDADNPSSLFIATKAGIHSFVYDIRGTFTDLYNAARTLNLTLAYRINGSGTLIHNYGSLGSGADNPITATLNEQGTLDLNLSIGDKISFYLAVTSYAGATTAELHSVTLTLNAGSSIKISSETIEYPSEITGLMIQEAFARICQAISGVDDCFRSDFFGAPDSYPNIYENTGCGRYYMITNGKAIRNMLDKDANPYPIIMSFNDLFEACNAIWNLGMRIENRFGKEYIVVEPKSYFFNQDSSLIFTNVSDITRTPAKEFIYNQFECGYEKWNLNVKGVNGIDEVNTKHFYNLPSLNAKQKLTAVSKFITSGYIIEQTRRIQYLSNPTTDFETDDLNFIISLNKDTVTSDLYSTPPVSQDYEKGTVSERDENFTDVENIVSPGTIYNLRLSPTRVALNWWPWLAASFARKIDTSVIRFASGEGNFLESDVLVDSSCNKASLGAVVQNQNIEKTSLIGTANYRSLFIPNYMEFEYPFSYSQFQQLIKNSINSIDISCENGNFTKGFIKEVTFMPNQDGGIAKFKLLEALCTGGGFDSGFDNGFDNNVCE